MTEYERMIGLADLCTEYGTISSDDLRGRFQKLSIGYKLLARELTLKEASQISKTTQNSLHRN